MTDAHRAWELWQHLKDDPQVDKVRVGKVVIYKRTEEQRSDEYDLRLVKI